MALINWDDSWSVHIKEMDVQHKVLAGLINDLNQAMGEGKGKEVLGKTLADLVRYTHSHFRDEEALLQRHAYPGLGKQKAEHEALTKKVMDLQVQLGKNSTGLTIPVMVFLKDWLYNHIQGSDKMYGQYLNNRGIT